MERKESNQTKQTNKEGHAKCEMGAQENLILSHANNKGAT